MFGTVRTAVRFFFIGFVTGALLAPRAGAETRALIREKLDLVAQSVMEIASFSPAEDGSRAGDRSSDASQRRARARRGEGSGAGSQS